MKVQQITVVTSEDASEIIQTPGAHKNDRANVRRIFRNMTTDWGVIFYAAGIRVKFNERGMDVILSGDIPWVQGIPYRVHYLEGLRTMLTIIADGGAAAMLHRGGLIGLAWRADGLNIYHLSA